METGFCLPPVPQQDVSQIIGNCGLRAMLMAVFWDCSMAVYQDAFESWDNSSNLIVQTTVIISADCQGLKS
jgi:hypothetical protein